MVRWVPVRDIPAQPWGWVFAGAVMMMLAGWEWYWRAFDATPSSRSNSALWAIQRGRIDHGEGDATVLIGDSRMFFDLQLPVWERLAGKRPVQLAFEGSSSLPFLEDLAADPNFTGRLLISGTPINLFNESSGHIEAIRYYRDESPSQRVGQWLSMHFVDPFFAFDDPDFALATVIERQPWPKRPGAAHVVRVRKLSQSAADRNTHMWSRVETDPEYRALARSIWAQRFADQKVNPPPLKRQENIARIIGRAARAIDALHSRGVKVLFVRLPSSGPYLEVENTIFPRTTAWEPLLAGTKTPGIHFQDYPELNRFEPPEWSHLAWQDAEQFTESLYRIIQRDFWPRED